MTNDHLVITEPDLYYGEGIRVFLIDWESELIASLTDAIQHCQNKIILYVGFSSNQEWMMNVSFQSDLVILNLNKHSENDILKGSIIRKDNVAYYGRSDIEQLIPGYIQDPIGFVLSWINTVQAKNEVKLLS